MCNVFIRTQWCNEKHSKWGSSRPVNGLQVYLSVHVLWLRKSAQWLTGSDITVPAVPATTRFHATNNRRCIYYWLE